jgi:Fe-S-cluster containining protein
VSDQRQEVTRGLLYDHTRINSITAKNIEVSSFLYALIEILNEKGLLTIEELDERGKQASCMQGNMLQTSFCSLQAGCEKGIVSWEFGRPSLIAHGDDGYCVHIDRNTFQCTVRDHRHVPCRGFGCQDNERWHVWADHEKMILNHGFIEHIENSAKIYKRLEIKPNG